MTGTAPNTNAARTLAGAPPGSWRLVAAMVARGEFGEPGSTRSRPSITASASAIIGYFQ